MQSLINSYLAYLKDDIGASPCTISAYSSALGRFLAFTGDIPLAELTDKTLQDYREAVLALPVSYKTKNLRLIPVRQFLKYLIEIDRMKAPDRTILRTFSQKSHTDLRVFPSTEQVAYFLQDTKDGRTDLLLRLLYATGMRISELLARKVGEITDQFPILGKGSKQRIIFCPEALVKHVRTYEKGKSGLLFPITSTRVQALLRARSDRMGLKVTPHTLRHCFATHRLAKGANVVYVQRWLGHARLATTEGYLHVSNKDLAEQYKKFS